MASSGTGWFTVRLIEEGTDTDGGTSTTSTVISTVTVPPEFVAEMTWVRASCDMFGVPVMVPVASSRTIPAGSGGWTDQVTTSPPMEMAVTGAIGVPNVAWSDVEA